MCRDGIGHFSSKFSTGVTVSVRASTNRGFAAHSCDATLRWGKNVLPVVQGAWRVDIDVMGPDLGLGVPVVAFQIRKSERDPLATYEVFSLRKHPRLLRTITGADDYDAKDRDLRGSVEIWTDEARAVDGFESLPLSSWDFLPTVVLRFEHKRLVDVSSEFQPYFDHQITQVKSQLSAKALSEFRQSDGKLSSFSPTGSGDLHTLIRTKIRVLGIVWAYLESGRQQQAWSELAAMWPPADLNRIRTAIQDARARGILAQVDEVAKPGAGADRRRHVRVYDCTQSGSSGSAPAPGNVSVDNRSMSSYTGLAGVGAESTPPSVVAPSQPKAISIAILSSRSQDQAMPDSGSQIYLNLIVDEAGKVHSAQLASKPENGAIGEKVLKASADWNFIPAFLYGHAVACRIRTGVWPQQ